MVPCNELNLDPQEFAPLFLLVRVGDSEHEFELSVNDDRVVVVGSAQSAEIRLDQPGIAPIQFYFERLGNNVCLVPVYCISELRVNTARVTKPHRLSRRSIIEFGNTRVRAEVSFSPRQSQSPTSHSHPEGQVVSRVAYLAQLPEGDAPTRQPWIDDGNGTNLDVASQTLCIKAAARDQHLELEANTMRGVVHTEQCPSFEAAFHKTEFAPVMALLAVNVPSPGKSSDSASADESGAIGSSKVEPLSKTLLGLAPPSLIADEATRSKPLGSGLHSAGTLRLANPGQLATVFDFPGVDRLIQRRYGWLVRIGLLAKRYPIRVSLSAIAIALAGSGSVVFATKVFLMRGAPKATSARPPGVTKPILTVPPLGNPRGDVEPKEHLRGPSIIVVSPMSIGGNLSPGAFSSTNHAPLPTNFAGAISNLVRGHYVEAQVSYAFLAQHSSADRTNAVLSRLLTRRLSPQCINTISASPKISCPEIKP